MFKTGALKILSKTPFWIPSTTATGVFPILLKMANYYLRKSTIDKGSAIYFEKSIGELENMINMSTMPIPSRMNLEDQGIFILGYYHQTQKRYTNKGDK